MAALCRDAATEMWIALRNFLGYKGGAMNDAIRIKDLPEHERPRERLAAHGAEALRDAELIAILLRTGMKGRSAVQIGDELVGKYRTLTALSRASLEDLRKVKGIGRDKAIALKSALTLAARMAQEMGGPAPLLDTPEAVADYLREENLSYSVENLQVLLLNSRRKLIRVDRISKGLVDSIMVHPREVFRGAIAANASTVVLVHNHPTGDPTPSETDIRATRELIRAGQLLKIEVADHVILGQRTTANPKGYVSMREMGLVFSGMA